MSNSSQSPESLDAKRTIRKGFAWIGAGAMISQVLDALSFFIVMLFLAKSDIGLGTLACGFAAFYEAFKGLGTSVALLQDNKLTRDETDSVFWFSTSFGILAFIVSIPLSIGIAAFYSSDVLFPLLLAAFLKVVFISTADVPFQLINRRFDFHQISIIQMSSTFLSAIIKILFAFLGFGAWALVLANTLYGLCSSTLSIVFSRYKPRLHFRWSECQRFISFGIKHCISAGIEQFNRNLHYFVIGKICGESILGLYRVAYEFAMTPAMALFRVVNTSSFPVFAKIKQDKDRLSEVFMWNQKNIAIFASVPIVFIYFCAIDVFTIQDIPDWFEVLPIIAPALVMSLFRCIFQTFPEFYRAVTRPNLSLRAALIEMLLCLLCFPLILTFFSDILGLQLMLMAWVGILSILFVFHYHWSKDFISIRPFAIPRSFAYALAFFLICAAPCRILFHFREGLPFFPWSHIFGQVIIIGICLFIYVKNILKITLKKPAKELAS